MFVRVKHHLCNIPVLMDVFFTSVMWKYISLGLFCFITFQLTTDDLKNHIVNRSVMVEPEWWYDNGNMFETLAGKTVVIRRRSEVEPHTVFHCFFCNTERTILEQDYFYCLI